MVSDPAGELRKTRKQNPKAHVHMDKKSETPMVDVDVILLDTQKSDVQFVRNIGGGYSGHQKSKKAER